MKRKKRWLVLYLKPTHWQFKFYTGRTMGGGETKEVNAEEYSQIQTNRPDDFAILSSPAPDKLETVLKPVERILKPIDEPEKEKHICPECGKICKTKMGLVSHLRVHKK